MFKCPNCGCQDIVTDTLMRTVTSYDDYGNVVQANTVAQSQNHLGTCLDCDEPLDLEFWNSEIEEVILE